jgi:hypothetical protein
MSSHTSLTEWEVLNMLELGVEHGVIIERLVETGDWSTSGANEIVRFMTRGPDPLMNAHVPLPRPRRARDPRGAGFRKRSWA